jgi:hypothetical protein
MLHKLRACCPYCQIDRVSLVSYRQDTIAHAEMALMWLMKRVVAGGK